MDLTQTVQLMSSLNHEDRFRAEHIQLLIRIKGLLDMLNKYRAGTLSFKPACSYELLHDQLKAMVIYLQYLEQRAKIENIDLLEL